MVINKNNIYFEVGKGWRKLCSEMIAELHELSTEISILQVKQKYALLTVYWTYENDITDQDEQQIESIIRKYSLVASITCELCGLTGEEVRLTEGYWKMCLCKQCQMEE